MSDLHALKDLEVSEASEVSLFFTSLIRISLIVFKYLITSSLPGSSGASFNFNNIFLMRTFNGIDSLHPASFAI